MIANTGSITQSCFVFLFPFSESGVLSCLNRMIGAGLKGPSVRGALRQNKRQHMWEVPNKPPLINLFSTVR